VALEVGRALHAGDTKPLKDWIADWEIAEMSATEPRRRVCLFPGHKCGPAENPSAARVASHAAREICFVAKEAWQTMPTEENYEIYLTARKRVLSGSHTNFNWLSRRCLTDNSICSGKPDSACCRGCLRHAAAVFPVFSAMEGKTRAEAWAEAWWSTSPDHSKTLQPPPADDAEEKAARIAAATALNPEAADLISAAVTIGFHV